MLLLAAMRTSISAWRARNPASRGTSQSEANDSEVVTVTTWVCGARKASTVTVMSASARDAVR